MVHSLDLLARCELPQHTTLTSAWHAAACVWQQAPAGRGRKAAKRTEAVRQPARAPSDIHDKSACPALSWTAFGATAKLHYTSHPRNAAPAAHLARPLQCRHATRQRCTQLSLTLHAQLVVRQHALRLLPSDARRQLQGQQSRAGGAG